jgi:N,N'-diacetyllegionaminate synthase
MINKCPYVIAEIGINHNGSGDLAFLMCELAIKAGASAVKFQLFDPDSLVSKSAEMADYQKQNSSIDEPQHTMLARNMITIETLRSCRDICNRQNIDFICTAFDEGSLSDVIALKPDYLKWPSGEIDNIPLLRTATRYKLPIIISAGMADAKEIETAVDTCLTSGLSEEEIILLHCTSQYPTPIEESNIASVSYLRDTFNLTIGFSDHTMGSHAACLALASGAQVFEKHVTLSRLMNGVDHRASANFEELGQYIEDLKHTSQIMGSYEKKCFPVEEQTKSIARKSLVAKTEIQVGEKLSVENIASMRPGTGISPKFQDEILGLKVNKTILQGQILSWNDIS